MKVSKPNMAQKGTITVEKTGEVFFGVNVSGTEDSDVIYHRFMKSQVLRVLFMKSVLLKIFTLLTELSVILRAKL